MKKLITTILCLAGLSAIAQVNSTATLTSDYVWRGLTQTNHESAIQGSIDYTHTSGLTVGAWVSSLNKNYSTDNNGFAKETNFLGQEVDLYISYKLNISESNSLTFGITDYTYTRDSNSNWAEYSLAYDSKWFTLFVGSTNDFGGNSNDIKSTYLNISKIINFKKSNVGLTFTYGMTTIDDEEKFGQTGYSDYKVAISKAKGSWTTELFYTNTIGRETSPSSVEYEQDSVVGFSLSTNLQ